MVELAVVYTIYHGYVHGGCAVYMQQYVIRLQYPTPLGAGQFLIVQECLVDISAALYI